MVIWSKVSKQQKTTRCGVFQTRPGILITSPELTSPVRNKIDLSYSREFYTHTPNSLAVKAQSS